MIKHSSFDATTSALDLETSAFGAATLAIARMSFYATISAFDAKMSAIARSYWRYRRGVSGNCRVGITPQMCNRVTNHGDTSAFSKPVLHICKVVQTLHSAHFQKTYPNSIPSKWAKNSVAIELDH